MSSNNRVGAIVTEYYAKSPREDGKRLTVKLHLQWTAELAREFGRQVGLEREAELCGLFHDFGKYSFRFQGVLRGTHEGIDHSISGAAALLAATKARPQYRACIEAINAHHAGLRDYSQLEPVLRESIASRRPVHFNDGKEAALAGKDEYNTAMKAFLADFPEYIIPSVPPADGGKVEKMLQTRMLFSCLVDGDYSSSAQWDEKGYIEKEKTQALDAKLSLKRLYDYRDSIRATSVSDSGLNVLRNQLFEKCGNKGESAEGLYTLTAPTGMGKTLALLHFALRHCLETGKERIIVVLPFLTLAEQSADTYERILPNVLQDHSQSDLTEEQRQLSARWSAPFIITTTVKFFESLFAQRPADCRKLHSIANSVVIFDESQSLPPEVTSATLETVNELCRRYHCTVVFSTATQPSFDALKNVRWQPTEIIPDYARLYSALKRTKVEWRLASRISLEAIAVEMAEQHSVCAIVNLRAHARTLYGKLKLACPAGEVFFLTTDLCPQHRMEKVRLIRQRLEAGLPCRVAATQCIEAGVDLDFDVMYRSLAPLEAIIQAAGRCNRNGRNPDGGQVIVFEPDEERLYPSDWYNNAALLVTELLKKGDVDINNPEHIDAYYQRLFKEAKDKPALRDAISKNDYPATAREYRLIDDKGERVIVPFKGMEQLYLEICGEARANGLTAALIKRAAPITVNTFDREGVSNHCESLPLAGRRGRGTEKSGFYVLLNGHESCYTDDMGLQFKESAAEDYII